MTPGSDERSLKTGDVVFVRRGKNNGKQFVVVGIESETRVFIADGRTYSVKKPKKKNVKHLQKRLINLKDVAGRVAGGKPLDNGWLAQKVSWFWMTATSCGDREVEAAAWPKKK